MLTRWMLKRRRKQLPVREFISRLNAVTMTTDTQTLETVSQLLRQYAIHQYGREKVALLHGTAWLAFLDSSTISQDGFSRGAGRVLGDNMYQPSPKLDLDELKNFLIRWTRGKV